MRLFLSRNRLCCVWLDGWWCVGVEGFAKFCGCEAGSELERVFWLVVEFPGEMGVRVVAKVVSKDFMVDSEVAASRWKSGNGWSCFGRICEWLVMRFSPADVARSFGDGFDWWKLYSGDLLASWPVCSGVAGIMDYNGGGVVFLANGDEV